MLCEVATRTGNLMGDARPRLWRGDEAVASMAGLGTFAEQTVVPESAVVPIDRSLPFEIAAIVGCAVTTGVGAVLNTARGRARRERARGRLRRRRPVGDPGRAARRRPRRSSPSTWSPPSARSRCSSAPRTRSTPPTATSASRSASLTGGRGVRYAFEAIGRADTIETAYESLEHGGTMTVVGQVPDGVRISIDPYAMSDFEYTLTGSNYGSANPAIDFPRLLGWYADGRLDLDPLVARRISLADINDAFAELATGRATRSVIVYGT